MADGYVDHGAYASALGATPTWGVPQEGDGSATAASSAASVASVVFGSVPSSGALSICGVSPSMSGVTGAANVDAAANALASNINATTTAVGASVAVGTPRLQNLVFARGPAGGAPAGTCEIMMRVGSTTLNHATNSNVAITHTFNTSPTITQFAGGVGGCYGWLINDVAVGVSGFHTAGTYGVAVATPYVRTFTPTEADFIYVRTGSGKTVTMPNGISLSRGNLGWPLNLVFDTNTKWTGDSGNGVFELRLKANSSGFVYFRPENGGGSGAPNRTTYSCLKRKNFKVALSVTNSSSTAALFDSAGCFVGRGIEFSEWESPGSLASIIFHANNVSTLRLEDCGFSFDAYQRNNLQYGPRFNLSSSGGGHLAVVGGAFKVNLVGVPPDTFGLFTVSSAIASGSYGIDILFDHVAFSSGSATKLKAFTSNPAVVDNYAHIVFNECSGIALSGTAIGMQAAANHQRQSKNNGVMFIGGDVGAEQRFEYRNGIAEWNPGASPAQPTLGATQFDGTPYSIRLYWLGTSSMSQFTPFGYTSSRLNRLADGIRTVVQEIAYDTTRGIDGRLLAARLSYIDEDGIARVQNTWGTDPASSSASWTGLGSWANFAARKFTFTTEYPAKQWTRVNVEVYVVGQAPGGGNTDIFIDPEPSIT